MAPNSVVPFPFVPPAFNFLLELQPEPSWGPERVLVDRAELAAKRLQNLAETSPFDFFGDTNTPLPGPWCEPIRFRYFAHTPNCPNKISPSDLLDSYERPLNVRACPHCHGRLGRGESAPNTWCTPLHWDVATQEVFAARPIPKPTCPAYTRHYFESANNSPLSRFVVKSTVTQDPAYPERKDAGPFAAGDWEDWVAPELKSWNTNQESHPLDQNYFRPERMQGAVRNNFCIFRVIPDESNTPQISHSYPSVIDDKGKKLTKPILCLRMDVDPGDRALEEGLDESDESDMKRHYRLAPWKPMHFVFENDDDVFRVWWLSIGKARVTTDTTRLREEYALDRKTQFEHAVLLREASPQSRVLCAGDMCWFTTPLPSPTKEEKADWDKVLRIAACLN